VFTLASDDNPYHGQDAALLFSRAYVFATFGGRWPVVAFLFSALSGNLAGSPSGPPHSAEIQKRTGNDFTLRAAEIEGFLAHLSSVVVQQTIHSERFLH
jgi:hypothetical protein